MPESLLLGCILLSLLIGGLIGWLWARLRISKDIVGSSELAKRYVLREVYEQLQQQWETQKTDLQEKETAIRQLTANVAAHQQDLSHLQEKLGRQQQEVERLQQQAQITFENIANRLLDEKSTRFVASNQQQMQELLQPLREKIKDFEENIERKFLDEAKDRISLKTEIEQLRTLNQQLSQDAHSLAEALKGDSKTQGDWGELRLEVLLEQAGLQKHIHYRTQQSFTDAEGQQKRPDVIVDLPEGKHLIIDAKVSLTAFERFFNCDDEHTRRQHLQAHVESIRRHIKDLSSRNYQHLDQIHSPDYLLLFIPIESAFTVATKHDPQLFLDALDKQIVIVTTTTLLATMRTVAYIWKQEKQQKNVLEIARQSGLLYDKFCAFVEDLRAIGQRLDQAQSSYQDAMNKLSESRKFGDTLIGRAERIRELGAKTSRQLPPELLEKPASDNGLLE